MVLFKLLNKIGHVYEHWECATEISNLTGQELMDSTALTVVPAMIQITGLYQHTHTNTFLCLEYLIATKI